jgi:hypothetical protein
MCFAAARAVCATPCRLTSISAYQSSRSNSSIVPSGISGVLRERRARLVQALGVPVRDDHDRAAVRQDLGERVAQARRSPGDQPHLIAHVEQRGEDGPGPGGAGAG